MSVEEASVIDAIGVEKDSGKVVLTISDHLDWENESAHLVKLQEKINKYLAFVESGEILESYPDARGCDVVVEIFAKYPLTLAATEFVEAARRVLREAGFELRFKAVGPEPK